MAETKPPLPKITSLAEHPEKGRADIESGRFTDLEDEAAIDRFFEDLWPAR